MRLHKYSFRWVLVSAFYLRLRAITSSTTTATGSCPWVSTWCLVTQNQTDFRDALLTSVINCVTSLISGFVIFCTLGYMSKRLNKDISNVAGEGGAPEGLLQPSLRETPGFSGPGLVFVVYPQAIATMEWSPFWATIFFFMLITLGIDSTVRLTHFYRP